MNTKELIEEVNRKAGRRARSLVGHKDWKDSESKDNKKLKTNVFFKKGASTSSIKHNSAYLIPSTTKNETSSITQECSKLDFSHSKPSFMMYPQYSKTIRKRDTLNKQKTKPKFRKNKSQRPFSVSFASKKFAKDELKRRIKRKSLFTKTKS